MHPGRRLVLVGEVLITLGVVLAGYVFYQVVWTNRASATLQSAASERLEEAWRAPENPRAVSLADDGDEPVPFVRIRIPEFGGDFDYAVVSGVTDADLDAGPGHYPESQGPGEAGNFALAGHRVGRGAPFNALGRLAVCDAIIIETADTWLDYRVLPTIGGEFGDAPDPAAAMDSASACMPRDIIDRLSTDYANVPGRQIVAPSHTDVLDPIPGREATQESRQLPLLTLTTCHPQFSAAERLIVHAVLVDTTDKSDGGRPPALEGR